MLVPRCDDHVEHALKYGLEGAVDKQVRRRDGQEPLARLLFEASPVALADLGHDVLKLRLGDRNLCLDQERRQPTPLAMGDATSCRSIGSIEAQRQTHERALPRPRRVSQGK